MLMYVITGPEGDDRFFSEDVQVCLANMGKGERVYIVNYEENDRELVASFNRKQKEKADEKNTDYIDDPGDRDDGRGGGQAVP